MDILAYAAQKRAVDLCNCLNINNCTAINQAVYCNGNTAGYSAIINTNLLPYYCGCCNYYNCYQILGREALDKTPWCFCYWTSIPTLVGTGFQVCSTSVGTVGSGGGACCLFTVPSGVSYVRFQMWGAGGNAGSGCCCGGSGFGSTGAYASVILPAIAGCQYTLCAGSVATTTPTLWGNYSNYACISNASYVTGYGLSNVCASGGRGFSPCCILGNDLGGYYAAQSSYWASSDCAAAGYGAGICNTANDYCHIGYSSCGCIPFSKTNAVNWYGKNTLNINCCCSSQICSIGGFWWGQVVGINGLNGSDCWNSSFAGVKQHPPIYGFETVSQCVICGAGTTVGGLYCNGCAYNYMRYPGAGGSGVFLYSCTTTCDPSGCFGSSCGGDIGRGGMVCVSYS
jgi:hypothetical protein